MKLKNAIERARARHLLQHTIRLANHRVEHPDHYGAEHATTLAAYGVLWAGYDPEQRAEAVALLRAAITAAVAEEYVRRFGARDALTPDSAPTAVRAAMSAHPVDAGTALAFSGVADLTEDAISAAIATLEDPNSTLTEG